MKTERSFKFSLSQSGQS